MNPTIVLVLLLLAVPLQLFFNHYLEQSYSAGSVEGDHDGLDGVRLNALQRLGSSVVSLKHQFGATIRHYSSWKNLRELFVIPRRKKAKKTEAIHISTFKSESGNKKIKIVTSNKQSATKAKPSTSSQSNTKSNTLKKKEPKEAPTSKAKEVEEYMMREVYFAQSREPRTKRPSNVHFVVGQVVKHKMDGYHGVIIGWDPVAKAPDWWIERFYAKDRIEHLITTPHYHILADSNYDASGTPYHYIPAEDLEAAAGTNLQISAPEVDNFFEGFKNGKHIPRPWLKDRYPLD